MFTRQWLLGAGLAGAMALGLGCGEEPSHTPPSGSMSESMQDAAEDTKDAVEDAADATKDKLEDGADAVEDAADDVADKLD